MTDTVTLSPPDAPASEDIAVGDPTWEVVDLYPRHGEWTKASYLALTECGRGVEFEQGFVRFLPMPTKQHQLVVKWLQYRLEQVTGFDRVIPGAYAVQTADGRFRQPDIVYAENPDDLGDKFATAADLAIEVVSDAPSDRDRDFVQKRAEYAAAGIREYWIVDPADRAVTVLTLKDGTYVEHGRFAEGQTATSLVVPDFAVPVAELFAAAGV